LTSPALAASNIAPSSEEARMNWHQIGEGWRQLKVDFAFWWSGHKDDVGEREALIGASASWDVENDDARTTALRSDNLDHRCDFSQHISC
jgi:hypothetical protein